MKILLCGFDDLIGGAGKRRVDQLRLSDAPFFQDDIIRADIVAVIGGSRALILKDARGEATPHVVHAATLLARIESEAAK